MTLTEFLLARIADDETWAQFVQSSGIHIAQGPSSSASSAARVLAECEAKRRMIRDVDGLSGQWYDEIEDKVLTALALPYADHPDFREEWRL